jgi:hypothetical protein
MSKETRKKNGTPLLIEERHLHQVAILRVLLLDKLFVDHVTTGTEREFLMGHREQSMSKNF